MSQSRHLALIGDRVVGTKYVRIGRIIRRGRQLTQHAFPRCIRPCLLLRAVCQILVVVGSERVCGCDIRQRRISVCDDSSRQDGQRHRIGTGMYHVMLSCLSDPLQISQLPQECQTL